MGLEDLSLRYLDPVNYYDLDRVSKRRQEREEYIKEIIKTLSNKLDEVKIEYDISGDLRTFIDDKKMVHQGKAFDQILT